MFTVAMFPATLQVAPNKTASQNASAVKVNNFSISKRAIPIEERRMEQKNEKGKPQKRTKAGWAGWKGGGDGGRWKGRRERVKVVGILLD